MVQHRRRRILNHPIILFAEFIFSKMAKLWPCLQEESTQHTRNGLVTRASDNLTMTDAAFTCLPCVTWEIAISGIHVWFQRSFVTYKKDSMQAVKCLNCLYTTMVVLMPWRLLSMMLAGIVRDTHRSMCTMTRSKQWTPRRLPWADLEDKYKKVQASTQACKQANNKDGGSDFGYNK
jgi:hypothetical protein